MEDFVFEKIQRKKSGVLPKGELKNIYMVISILQKKVIIRKRLSELYKNF